MNIDGINTLACIYGLDEIKGDVKIYPLPHMAVIKDLIRTSRISTPSTHPSCPGARRRRTARQGMAPVDRRPEEARRAYECVMCASCSTSCPSYWWNSDRYLGPAALLHAYRWIIDSRDEATANGWMRWRIRSSCIAATRS